jgi:Protein of unknown function (DUF732)
MADDDRRTDEIAIRELIDHQAAQAVMAGRSVCGCLNNGESGLELFHDVKTHNAGSTMEDASDFATISAKYYCPQQLSKSDINDAAA